MAKAVYLRWEGRSYQLEDLRTDVESIILKLKLDDNTPVLYTLVDVGVVITTEATGDDTEWLDVRYGVFTPITDQEELDFLRNEVGQNPLVSAPNVKSMIGEWFLSGWM